MSSAAGLWDRVRNGLARTQERISERLQGALDRPMRLDEAAVEELEEALIAADLGVATTELLLARLREQVRRSDSAPERLRDRLRDEIARLLEEAPDAPQERWPRVTLVVGVNGAGKTTSIAKLARREQAAGRTVLLAAGDTFRAAAAEQLEIWAERNGAPIVRAREGADPASVAFDAVESACVLGIDVAILDTAGRLHTQRNLMEQLGKVQRVIAKRLPGAPHEVWLVIDGVNGQNAIQQAKQFTAHVPVTGLVVTKLDGTARGGAVCSIVRELKLPVRYIGTGEQLELLEPFDPHAFVDAILGAAVAR